MGHKNAWRYPKVSLLHDIWEKKRSGRFAQMGVMSPRYPTAHAGCTPGAPFTNMV